MDTRRRNVRLLVRALAAEHDVSAVGMIRWLSREPEIETVMQTNGVEPARLLRSVAALEERSATESGLLSKMMAAQQMFVRTGLIGGDHTMEPTELACDFLTFTPSRRFTAAATGAQGAAAVDLSDPEAAIASIPEFAGCVFAALAERLPDLAASLRAASATLLAEVA